MKKLLIVTAAAASLLAAPAFAAVVGVSGTVTISGSVAAKCVIDPAATIGTTADELTAADGTYNLFFNNKTATLNGWCNGTSSTIAVVAHPVTTGAASSGNFTNTIHYTATAKVTNAAGTVITESDTSATAGADNPATTVGLFSNPIEVKLTLSNPTTATDKLIAGNYSGTTVVTLTPSL
jgi:hypothetical protein